MDSSAIVSARIGHHRRRDDRDPPGGKMKLTRHTPRNIFSPREYIHACVFFFFFIFRLTEYLPRISSCLRISPIDSDVVTR